MLRVWNVSLICATFALSLLGTFLVRSGVLQSIHAFGESKVGPPLLALIAVVVIGSTILIVSRLDVLRSERRLDSLLQPRVGLPRQQPAARRARRGGLLGHVLPADLRGGRPGSAPRSAAPWFNRVRDPARDRARALHGDRAAGRLAAGDAWRAAARIVRRSRSRRPPRSRSPSRSAIARGESPTALRAVPSPAVRARRARAGVRPRRRARAARSPAAACPRRSAALVTRNRRRYGGYVVHVGLVAGRCSRIAASSSFQTSRDLRLSPATAPTVGDYTVTYERADQRASTVRASRSSPSARCSSVPRDGEHVATLQPVARVLLGRIARSGCADPRASSRARRRARSGARTGSARDLWSAMQPDLSALRRRDRARRRPR